MPVKQGFFSSLKRDIDPPFFAFPVTSLSPLYLKAAPATVPRPVGQCLEWLPAHFATPDMIRLVYLILQQLTFLVFQKNTLEAFADDRIGNHLRTLRIQGKAESGCTVVVGTNAFDQSYCTSGLTC